MLAVETLNKLLRDELSATQTYQQALDKFKEELNNKESEFLVPIYEDHKDAVTILQEQITRMGGLPEQSSGAWGTWTQLVQGGAIMMGKKAAVNALQEGEKMGMDDYGEVLQDSDGELPSEVRMIIENELLPAQESHVRTLDRLMEIISA